jgi:hypothetical protein
MHRQQNPNLEILEAAVAEVRESDETLRRHLESRFAALLRDPDFVAALPGHLPGDAANQLRVPLVLLRIEELITAE